MLLNISQMSKVMDSSKANCYIGEVGIAKKYLKCLPYIAIVWSDFYESNLATSKMLSMLSCLDIFLGLCKRELKSNNKFTATINGEDEQIYFFVPINPHRSDKTKYNFCKSQE